MLNHKEFFFQGGLPLTIFCTTTLPPNTVFNLILLTFTSYQQLQTPPTSIGFDDGAAEYLQEVLNYTPVNPANGARPAPWIIPSVATPQQALEWNCLDKRYILTHNTSLSFCPGSII